MKKKFLYPSIILKLNKYPYNDWGKNNIMQWIFNILGTMSEAQSGVITASIGLISAFLVAVVGLFGSALTIYVNKKHERKADLRKIKEKQYVDFLGCLALAKISTIDEKHENNMLLSSNIQTIYLVGSKDVQMALDEFLKLFTSGNHSVENQAILYAKLISAMRKDLYGKCCDSMEIVSFTVFSD